MASAVLADPRPRARARRRRAAPRRWDRAVGPPGRRAVGHADGARRGDRNAQRRRSRCSRRSTRELPDLEDELPDVVDEIDVEVEAAVEIEDEDDEEEEEESSNPRPTTPLNGEVVDEEEQLPEQPEDPGAARRFWFEHATGAGKTVAALGFVEASRTGGILILTHRRNLVDQFLGELRDRGYRDRISPPLLAPKDCGDGPVTVETYQWFVRNGGKISDAYTIVICDEAHTALGEKTSASISRWKEPVFVGMTATGALIARHVADLFPTQTSASTWPRPRVAA